MSQSTERGDILHGTLGLLVLRTLLAMGPQHGYGIARRIEQTSGNMLELNQGTLYPALLRLEQMGWISSRWGTSENNRRARFYAITAAGRKQLEKETRNWERAAEIVARFLATERASS
jgi:transcriptional regulator